MFMRTNRFSEFIEHFGFSVKAFLFDLDGVLLDSEGQYQVFWEKIAEEKGLDPTVFPMAIKGQNVYDTVKAYFPSSEGSAIVKRFIDYLVNLDYQLFDGARKVLEECGKHDIRTAIVTSSNKVKMDVVYRQYPFFHQVIDALITADDIAYKKPNPDCWLKASEVLGIDITKSVIFEDSILGLKSALASGGYVVGVATTLSAQTISPYCNHVITQISDLT